MRGFGFPELTQWLDLRHHFAGPQPRFIDVSDRVLGNPTLLVGRVEDRGPIARPDVGSLAIARARIVNLEEELEDPPIADLGRIKDDLDCFCMCSVIAICGIGCVAARLTDPRRQNAVLPANEILHTPKTTACKHRTFLSHCLSSTWSK